MAGCERGGGRRRDHARCLVNMAYAHPVGVAKALPLFSRRPSLSTSRYFYDPFDTEPPNHAQPLLSSPGQTNEMLRREENTRTSGLSRHAQKGCMDNRLRFSCSAIFPSSGKEAKQRRPSLQEREH